MQFEAGNELSDKAEAIAKTNGVLFGLVLTALGFSASLKLAFPPGVAPVWRAALFWDGPLFLFASMLFAAWAFRAVDFEIGLFEDQMVASLDYPLGEAEMLGNAIESYADGIKTNKASLNKVETLVSLGLFFMALGSAGLLSTGVLLWLGHGGP
jgi:hypothetical protein